MAEREVKAMRTSGMLEALAVALCAALAVGCDSEITTEPGEGGGGGGEITASTALATSGSGGSGAAGGGAACLGFEDAPEEGASPVTFRFRNETSQDIFLPAQCGEVAYHLEPDAGGDPTLYGDEPPCFRSCEDLQTEEPIACAPCAPGVFRLPPGGSLERTWGGQGRRPSAMPAECFLHPSGDDSCPQVVNAPAGTYVARATGYAACEGGCACEGPDVCFGEPAGASAKATVTFTHPADVVEIVFEACAFGCPEP